MYDSNFLELLKGKIILSDIIGRSVKVVQRGRRKVACCPFHNEKTPSFNINDDRGFYHCFGCGVHGDVFNFMMQKDGLSFRAAVEKLAEESGVVLPKSDKNTSERQKEISDKLTAVYSI
ncbi:MAG: DNA primase, partial [Rickettsiales bacterium]|nr:DNA primase [Rickettsiales bacterium]